MGNVMWFAVDAVIGAMLILLAWWAFKGITKMPAENELLRALRGIEAAREHYDGMWQRAKGIVDEAGAEAWRAETRRARVQGAMTAVCKVLRPQRGESPADAARRLVAEVAAARADERKACWEAVAALAEDKHGDIGDDFSGGWESALEEAESAIRARGPQ